MIDWQQLLTGSVDGVGLAVGGARVGDPMDALPLKDITDIIPQTPRERFQWGKEAASGPGTDAPRAGTSQAAQLDQLRQYGGYVQAGTVVYMVDQGRIQKIWVRGPWLSRLPFPQEADIERVLGPAKGLGREHGCVIYQYPERNFAVGWYVSENRLEHIALGGDWTPPSFGARRVLQEWLDAACAGLDPSWQEPEDRTTSLWVRHARVKALLRAFGLGTPVDFAEGNFLTEKPVSAYPLASQVMRGAPKGGLSPEPGFLARLFWWLLTYRLRAEKLLQLNSSIWLAGEAGIFMALRLSGDVNEDVEAALKPIDALLVELIDPSGKQVTERELIERWGWPDANLAELLLDEV